MGCWYLFAAFFLITCVAIFLTNQFHKWAHLEEPPPVAAWVQRNGLILSKEQHHEVYYESPCDTYYCITVDV